MKEHKINNISLYNCDNKELMRSLKDGSVDVILTDPPYLYLKNQKLEREFDEVLFFKECARILSDNGFLVFFGRGVSFHRWNVIVDEIKCQYGRYLHISEMEKDIDYKDVFNFKEEIVWDKSYITSPLTPISRHHESASIFTKGDGKINKTKVPYLEMKHHDIDSIVQDLKRLTSGLKNAQSLNDISEFLNNGVKTHSLPASESKYKVVRDTLHRSQDKALATLVAMVDGNNEKSIIKVAREHYTAIHPTQKPVRLLERLLALVIPQDKESKDIVVADFFGGSFSTMEATYNMGMKGISCEIDKEYFDSGKERIINISQQMKLF